MAGDDSLNRGFGSVKIVTEKASRRLAYPVAAWNGVS